MTKPLQSTDLKPLARQLLGRMLGFRDCAPAVLDALVEAGMVRSLGKSEVLALRGTAFEYLCLVIEGSLETSVTRQDGHRHLISYLQPGDLAGIIGLVDGMGHVHDLRARGESRVLLIPYGRIRELRRAHTDLVLASEAHLAFRSRLLYERLAADPSMPVEARLARLLQTLTELYGLPRGSEFLLDMKLAQSDLADWLGVSRQRVNTAVQQLQLAGLIRISYSTITITDAQGLAAYATGAGGEALAVPIG